MISISDQEGVKRHVAHALLRLRSKDFFPDFYRVMCRKDGLGSHVAFRCMATSREALRQACLSLTLWQGLADVNSLLWFGEGTLGFTDDHKVFAPVLWGSKAPMGKGKGHLVLLSSREGFTVRVKNQNQVSFPRYLHEELGGWLRILCQVPWGIVLEIPVTTKPKCIGLQVTAAGTSMSLDEEVCPELGKVGQ